MTANGQDNGANGADGADGADVEGIDVELATTTGLPPTASSTGAPPPVVTAAPLRPATSPGVLRSSGTTDSSGKVPAIPLGRLGRYVLEKPLGRGGMAEVFLARQEGPSGFSKRVVLKRIHRSLLGDDRYVQMFLREARIAARLNHTNLVQVFELGEQDDEYFLAMEHIDGLTLQKAARRAWGAGESVPMEVALRAVADAARGLHYAHTLRDDDDNDISLIHRDISPDNLMLTRDGVTKVLDFGVAKTRDGDAMTTDGELKGKIPFMSPEQIRTEPLDGRSDLWSLGVTLYWLLTGERPFPAHNEIASLHAIVHAEPRAPRDLNPLIPLPLQSLVLQLLTKDRSRRITTGAELSERLLALLGPAAAGPESAEFARHALALPDATGPQSRTETLAAARPHTEWLKAALHALHGGVVAAPSPTAQPTVPELPSAPLAPGFDALANARTAVSSGAPPPADAAPGTSAGPASGAPTAAPASLSATGPATASSEPLAATVVLPHAGALVATEPAPPPRAVQRSVVAGVALGAVFVAGLGALLVSRPKPGDRVVATTPVAAPPPGRATDGAPPRPGTTTTTSTTTDGVPTAAPPAPPPATPLANAPTASTPVAPANPAPMAPADPAPAPPANPAPAATTPPAPPRPTVRVTAPTSVRWETERGVRLGTGTAALPLPAGVTRVVARDSARGGRVVVDVVAGGAVDWDALPRGRLDVRVEPYADVVLGTEKLGTTPLPPLNVVAGEYTVVLVYEGQRVEKKVDVAAGRDTRVTHRF
jgi:serine/threonine protein kinase